MFFCFRMSRSIVYRVVCHNGRKGEWKTEEDGEKALVDEMKSKYCYPLVLEKNGIRKEEIGFWDTGNNLYAPWSGKPVFLTEHRHMKEFFDRKEYERQEKILQYKENAVVCQEKILWVPYRSVGRYQGVLPGMYVDHIWIKGRYKVIHNTQIVVAFCKETISEHEEYQMILHNSCQL